ncbi:methyltransferase family protein [Pseudoalteromonas sp. SS15]|uniref:methyltransferase family protein n=1 Tax=Pseudoalteromonas sp. SS15 TaxID=3139393 RepID=UPI003BAA6FB8
MHFLEHKIPPPFISLLSAAGMYYLSRSEFAISIDSIIDFKAKIALVMLVFSSWIALFAVWSFKQAKTTISPTRPNNTACLVTTGVFKYSRNPMYLSVALSLLAFAVFLADYSALCGVVLFVMYITQFQIKPEERILKEKFGAPYDVYLTKVRRWI